MTKSLNDIISDPQIFLSELFTRIEKTGLEIKEYYLDHICYRVGSQAEYDLKKEELLAHADLLIESMVNGRMISTYKLHSPILFNNRKIDVLELPAPKAGANYESGLEHVEFVIKEPLKNLVESYPALKFETGGIDKEINADITLRLADYCIRFHNQTLEEVIEQEKLLCLT